MGQILSQLKDPIEMYSMMIRERRKRKRNSDSDDISEDSAETHSPKKKKLLTTTQYIYQALFKEQKNSDISVMAVGNIWHLHKVYLCQSPYFYSMFNGPWKESSQDFVHIRISDPKITIEALDAVFGSMYSDEIEVDHKNVISVLACATLFQIDGIIEKCAEVMVESINTETAITYYDASCEYGTLNGKKASFEWLETNLLCVYSKNPKFLRDINVELMTALISSHDLYVMQTEFALYTLLRSWMYLKLFPNFDPENHSFEETEVAQNYFANLKDKKSFLESADGKKFIKAFQALRTQYLTNHHTDLKTILADNIIPKEWLSAHVMNHWKTILKIDHLSEKGPQQIDEKTFYQNCMRCGRVLIEPGYQKWRWTGFNFGLDLILIVDSRLFSIKRHSRIENERLLCLHATRQFMIRVSITSYNSQRQRVFTQKSDILSLSLEKNEESTLMILDQKLVYPLMISVNLLVIPPNEEPCEKSLFTNVEDSPVPISNIGDGNVALDRSTEEASSSNSSPSLSVPHASFIDLT